MNRIRCIAAILSGLATSVLVALTGTTAAFAYVVPAPGGCRPGAATQGAHHRHRGHARLADRAHHDRGRDRRRCPGRDPRPGPHRTPAAGRARSLTRWLLSSTRAA